MPSLPQDKDILIKNIHLGSGLIGIGRKWGVVETPIPTEEEVLAFLSSAIKQGIFYFDTAPAYGTSEERLGKFLLTIPSEQREKLIISTKFGEHWDATKQEAYVDHSYEALTTSLEKSLKLLGHIDLLYLHKATFKTLQDPTVARAFAYAKEQGIQHFGASVSDLEAADFVLSNDLYSVIQFPYNTANTLFADTIDQATKKGKVIVINRPFNMGQHRENKVAAFTFILHKQFNGFVLTGTKSPHHLQENIQAFTAAKIVKNNKN